jgi:hypothetical protein
MGQRYQDAREKDGSSGRRQCAIGGYDKLHGALHQHVQVEDGEGMAAKDKGDRASTYRGYFNASIFGVTCQNSSLEHRRTAER